MDMTPSDFLFFRRMITPTIIQIVFWVALVFVILAGLGMMVTGLLSLRQGGIALIFGGLVYIVLMPIFVRIYCELLIVIFRISQTATDILEQLKGGAKP